MKSCIFIFVHLYFTVETVTLNKTGENKWNYCEKTKLYNHTIVLYTTQFHGRDTKKRDKMEVCVWHDIASTCL